MLPVNNHRRTPQKLLIPYFKDSRYFCMNLSILPKLGYQRVSSESLIATYRNRLPFEENCRTHFYTVIGRITRYSRIFKVARKFHSKMEGSKNKKLFQGRSENKTITAITNTIIVTINGKLKIPSPSV
jgi:hypothetical protein